MTFNVNLERYTFPTPVKILMIVGQYKEHPINTDIDKKLISNLAGAIPKPVDVTSVEDVINALEQNQFDILIFSGHSRTLPDGTNAIIWLTDDLTIDINQIQNQIRTALGRKYHPLVLAIFNSCDGLGVDSQLTALNIRIPYLIAMRGKITDTTAHIFLERFLRFFVTNRKQFVEAFGAAQSGLNFGERLLPIPCFKAAPMPELYWPDNIIVSIHQLWIKTIALISELWRKKITRYVGLTIITILILIALSQFRNRYETGNQPPTPTPTPTLTPTPTPIAITDPPEMLPLSGLCEKNSQYISCGEQSLFGENNLSNDEELGIQAFKQKNYQKAIESFEKAFKVTTTKNKYKNGIFLENAKVLDLQKTNKNLQIFAVAVVIPTMKNDPYEPGIYPISQAILQGVYNQQQYFNDKNAINKLLVLIANDTNDSNKEDKKTQTKTPGIATKVAQELAEKTIYAIIGPYSSKIASETKDIYKNKNIVVMSYSNTATNITFQDMTIELKGPFFFRVCSNNQGIAEVLADKLKERYNKLTLFLKNDDIFSQSFGDELIKYWEKLPNKQIITPAGYKDNKNKVLFDKISSNDINPILENAQSQKIGIVLCPGAYTSENRKDIKYTQNILGQDRKELLIAGCNVLTSYAKVIQDGDVKNHRNIVVGVPWFYDRNNTNQEFEDWRKKWEQQKINFQTDSFMRMVLAQDATMVLTTALSEVSKPSGIELQRYLANPNNKFQGVTGEISFTGSDRTKDTSQVITPKCEPQGCNNWKGEWEIAN
jgi:branched-chain amino acid transport system substrate-binding protein